MIKSIPCSVALSVKVAVAPTCVVGRISSGILGKNDPITKPTIPRDTMRKVLALAQDPKFHQIHSNFQYQSCTHSASLFFVLLLLILIHSLPASPFVPSKNLQPNQLSLDLKIPTLRASHLFKKKKNPRRVVMNQMILTSVPQSRLLCQ